MHDVIDSFAIVIPIVAVIPVITIIGMMIGCCCSVMIHALLFIILSRMSMIIIARFLSVSLDGWGIRALGWNSFRFAVLKGSGAAEPF